MHVNVEGVIHVTSITCNICACTACQQHRHAFLQRRLSHFAETLSAMSFGRRLFDHRCVFCNLALGRGPTDGPDAVPPLDYPENLSLLQSFFCFRISDVRCAPSGVQWWIVTLFNAHSEPNYHTKCFCRIHDKAIFFVDLWGHISPTLSANGLALNLLQITWNI